MKPSLFRRTPVSRPALISQHQNNVSAQITIIKWHDIVVEIEICGWICSGWVDPQASTERKGLNKFNVKVRLHLTGLSFRNWFQSFNQWEAISCLNSKIIPINH